MVATQSQSFSISRRTLDVEDYIDIGRRHAGWIIGPAFFGIVAAICVAFLLRNQYVSKATMQITPAQINDNMIQSTISNSLNERIQQMETSILSHTELSSIINDPRLNLYHEELKTQPLDDVIEAMKGNINIQFVALPGALGRRASAFDITFTYYDRFKATQTVQALMNKFEEENLNTQKTDQDAVKGLVGDLLQKAKADLQDATDKLTSFKEGNAGKLPEQVGLNIALENGYTEKIKSADESIYRETQAIAQLETQKDTINGQLQFYDQEQAALASVAVPGSVAAQQNQELAALDKAIENGDFQLQQMRRSYNDKYPPIKTAQTQLDGYKARREALAKKIQAKAEADAASAAADAAKPKPATMTPADVKEMGLKHEVAQKIDGITAQEKFINENIARLKKEEEGYKKGSDDVNQMLKDSTGIEGTYEELKQNKAMAEQNEQELEKKQQLADANGQLIERKAGEVLEVLDPPSTPMQPTKPKRFMIIGAGFAMSIILGLGMAGLQEAKDTSLKNLKDVRAYTNLPVLCSIPLLENTMLVKRKRRLTYLAWAAAVIVGAAAVSGAVVYYYAVTMKS